MVETGTTALVVEGLPELRAAVADAMAAAGFDVVEAADGLDGWGKFRRVGPDLVVTGLRMPGADGLELLRRVRGAARVPVILLSAQADVASAVEAIRSGAAEFLRFPDDLDRLVERARELTAELPETAAARAAAAGIAGASAAAERLRERVVALAPLAVPVLVTGEPGSGRDHVVRCLHGGGPFRGDRLVTVEADSAAPPRATARGPFYLDGVDRFDPADQARWEQWLRRAEERQGPRPYRLFASASEPLPAAAGASTVVPPLARRLERFQIALPPLRERVEDVPYLAAALVERLGRELGRPRARLDAGALALLRHRPWSGNIRELAAAVEKLVAFSPDGSVTRSRAREVLGEAGDRVGSLRSQRDQRQRDELMALLERCGGNLAEVARQLDLSRGAVIYRARKHGLLARGGD